MVLYRCQQCMRSGSINNCYNLPFIASAIILQSGGLLTKRWNGKFIIWSAITAPPGNGSCQLARRVIPSPVAMPINGIFRACRLEHAQFSFHSGWQPQYYIGPTKWVSSDYQSPADAKKLHTRNHADRNKSGEMIFFRDMKELFQTGCVSSNYFITEPD